MAGFQLFTSGRFWVFTETDRGEARWEGVGQVGAGPRFYFLFLAAGKRRLTGANRLRTSESDYDGGTVAGAT